MSTALSVSEFLDQTNEVLGAIPATVQGEITSLKIYPKAVYFNLTDNHDKAVLNCMAWRSQLESFGFQLKEGLTVQIFGRAEIYKPSGRFSFLARTISPVGEGALKAAFEALKKKLAAEGYFDEAHKRPLPAYPERIGLITSARGAAVKDFTTHLAQAGFKVTLYDVLVQGTQAVDSLVQAIEWFNHQPQPVEVLVITRGGGSLEDLQPFNAESVAKAIFASKIPVISAVGHEQDVSISDWVADERASTPTAAAKRLSENWVLAPGQLEHLQLQVLNHFSRQLQASQFLLQSTPASLLNLFQRELQLQQHYCQQISQELAQQLDRLQHTITSLRQRFESHTQLVEKTLIRAHHGLQTLRQNLVQASQQRLHQHQTKLAHLSELLQANNPEQKLRQGYALLLAPDQKLLKSIHQLHPSDEVTVRLHDGQARTQVLSIQTNTQ